MKFRIKKRVNLSNRATTYAPERLVEGRWEKCEYLDEKMRISDAVFPTIDLAKDYIYGKGVVDETVVWEGEA